MYALGVVEDGESACKRCGGQKTQKTFERVDDLAGLPFLRRVRHYLHCESCGGWMEIEVDPNTRGRHPRTPGLLKRIVISWVLLGTFVGTLIAWSGYRHVEAKKHAASPQVGDRWTINTAKWPGDELAFENGLRYGRVEVNAVTSESVELAACNQTSDRSSKIEDACKTFRVEMSSRARSDVVRFFDDGQIDSIDPADADYTRWLCFVIGYIAMVFAYGFFTHRWLSARRRLIPRARARVKAQQTATSR